MTNMLEIETLATVEAIEEANLISFIVIAVVIIITILIAAAITRHFTKKGTKE